MIRVAVAGAHGRMGRETVRAVDDAPDMDVVAQIVRGDDVAVGIRGADVLVDFTTPDVVRANAEAAIDAGVVPIIGATGLSAGDLEALSARCAARGVGALVAPNFAIGALLMMRFAAEAAKFLPDVEIIEMHHEKKLDAPSGTAVKTAQLIAASREGAPITAPIGAFESAPGARGGLGEGDIRVHSVRLPGFVASQEVIFGGLGQRLSLRHDSLDRTSFMPGVLLAIRRASSLDGLIYGLERLL